MIIFRTAKISEKLAFIFALKLASRQFCKKQLICDDQPSCYCWAAQSLARLDSSANKDQNEHKFVTSVFATFL